uniref:Ycf80 n=1 Tax=Phaeocystis globosa TaxID=33658 RepID=A0A891ZQQ6_9EUKA|nr:Ycf80 [Phaeocystis globosa]
MGLNLNHYFSKERILDVISHEDKEPYAVSFFEDLYTYPPKIKIQWKQLDLVEKSDKLLPNKIINHPPHKSFSGVRDYMDKVISSDVYSKKIKLLKQTLKDVPVYVIVNGRTEIVVASTRSKKFNTIDPNVLDPGPFLEKPELITEGNEIRKVIRRQVYKRSVVESVGKALSTKSKKFGFIFFDPIEAQYYLDAMVARSEKKFHHRRDHSIDKVGLSIHCIGLDTAYSLLSRSSSNVDFRFVPSLPEVKAVLEHSSQGDTNNERQLEQTLSRKALSIISDQYNSAFKGVPIYIVVVKDKFEALQDSEKFKSSSTKTNSSANYIFFDREQALEFCEKYSSRMVSPIYTDNLEDFLELWGESLVLNTDVTQSFININQPTYFIPSKRSIKTLEQYYNRPKDSLGKSIKVWGRRKLSKLYWFRTNYLGLILRGNRI